MSKNKAGFNKTGVIIAAAAVVVVVVLAAFFVLRVVREEAIKIGG